MSAIFLSYRRDDSSGYAGRLFDNLAERFGRERVFMDIETLEPGMDFVAGIERAIESCGAVIAMIGPNWIDARDGEGRRRLDDPHDFIRLEIATALARGVRVIPVLVHNASMPLEQTLPEPLRPLCRLQACEISDNRWEFDVRRLADVLEPLVGGPRGDAQTAPRVATAPEASAKDATPSRKAGGGRTGWWAAVVALVLAAGGGVWWFSQPTPTGAPTATRIGTGVKPAPPDETTADVVRAVEPPPEPPVRVEPPPGASTDARRAEEPEPVAAPPPETHADAVPAVEPPPPESPARVKPRLEASTDTRPVVEPEPAATPMPPEPSPEEARQREIAELIRAAEIDVSELRLTRPAGDNAFERFQRVLELDPDNPTARDGLVVITERYHGLVEDALVRGALDSAQRHLDSASRVDPGADWLAPVQREIDQRRRDVARSGQGPERPRHPEKADVEACLAACESQHETCRAEAERREADCLNSRAEACEERYQSCMSDPGKLFRGEVSAKSECIGVHAECRKSAAKGCAAAPQIAAERCEAQFGACTQRCRDAQ